MIDRSRETSQIWAYLDALCREDVKRDLYSFSQEDKINDSEFAVLTATPSWEMGTSPCFIADTLQKKEMTITHKFKASEILGALYLNFQYPYWVFQL